MILLIVSFCLAIISIFYCQKVFIKKKIFDKINLRSSHDSIATRSGGLSFFIVLFLISVIYYVFGYELYDYSIIIPLSILFLVGLYDDINGIDFKLKFIFQIIVAKIIIDNGFIVDNLHGMFGIYEISRVLAQLITILIIVSIINAINFIDGIDGLAISIILMFIISFQFFALVNSNFNNLSIIIVACLIPFYYFNFRNRNKVFLGDSGSYLLGGLVSIYVLYILSQDYIIKPNFDVHKIIFVISILIYPIIDIIRIFIFRLYYGKSPFIADKNHIHHLILNKVKSHSLTVLIIVLFSIGTVFFTQILL